MSRSTDKIITAHRSGDNGLKCNETLLRLQLDQLNVAQHIEWLQNCDKTHFKLLVARCEVKRYLESALTKANIFTRVTFNTPAKPRPTSVGMLKSCGFFYAWRNQA